MYIYDKVMKLMVAKCGFRIDNYRPDLYIVSFVLSEKE